MRYLDRPGDLGKPATSSARSSGESTKSLPLAAPREQRSLCRLQASAQAALELPWKVESLTPSTTKPQGTVNMKWTMYNQHDQTVYAFTPMTIVSRRPQT
jgi:hypothetical protein